MKSNINQTPLRTYSSVPKSWESRPNLMNYDQADQAIHQEDGWRDVVNPTIGENQRRGALIHDQVNDVVTYEVIDLTEEEIKLRLISEAQGNRESAIQEKIKVQVEAEAQAIADNSEILDNQSLYPLWSDFEDGYTFPLDFKVQDFEGMELKIFRVIQSHAKQSDWNPIAVPALFTKIEISGGVEVWSQPTGGDGKYPYLDPTTGQQYLVTHNGQTWRNIHQGGLNVWSPGVFGWETV